MELISRVRRRQLLWPMSSLFGGGGEPQMSEEEAAQMAILQTMQLKDGMKTYNRIVKECATPSRMRVHTLPLAVAARAFAKVSQVWGGVRRARAAASRTA